MATQRKTRVLTNWQPSRLDEKTIQLELRVLLGTLLLNAGIPMVRSPKEHEELGDLQEIGWHKDNQGKDCMLVVWSNLKPTEVRFKNRRRLRARDGDVILLQNGAVEHRTPADAIDGRRWFARTIVTNFEQPST